ncbi:hypothetical protein GTGU_04395 [Trabulsiella guamensis ATCC 49490]|uniref:Uncharacterized protein n=1 Tax=Trabulsiella guamensis ATCC 49490 TaxID=1005994 RepID=A0A084ZMN0_9ENTR|nr:hypothetical protein [Trabulsiella guamensis]KFB98724.1 hypothetical protein GTGU_04395 [Trabulsiella guamensis ATCC 49490]
MHDDELQTKLSVIAKKIITPALLMGFLALFVIWLYLNRLGWLDIFIPSISFKDMFIVVASTFLVSLFSISLIIFLPSITLALIIKKLGNNILSEIGIKNNFIKIAIIVSSFAVSLFIFSTWLISHNESNTLAIMIASILLTITLSLLLSYFLNRRILSPKINISFNKNDLKVKYHYYITIPLLICVMTAFYAFPLSIIINRISENISDSTLIVYVLATSLFAVNFALIPGIVYIREHESKARMLMTGYAVFFSLFSMSWVITPLPVLVINASMKILGINNYNPHSYLINEEQYPIEIFNIKNWNSRKTTGKGHYLIDGITMYSFGDIKLVCPVHVLDAYNNSIKFIPADKIYDGKLNDTLKEKARECHAFQKNELREFNIIKHNVS